MNNPEKRRTLCSILYVYFYLILHNHMTQLSQPDDHQNKGADPYEEKRPWGEFERFTFNAPSTVKILVINPGQSTSLQLHHHRDEYWHVLSGNGTLTIGDNDVDAVPERNYLVPRTTKHRISGGTEALMILEISTGTFDEEDIVRLEDNYGRAQ